MGPACSTRSGVVCAEVAMAEKTRRTWDGTLITLVAVVALISLPGCFIFETDDDDDDPGADTFSSGDTGSNTNNNNTTNNTNTSTGFNGLWVWQESDSSYYHFEIVNDFASLGYYFAGDSELPAYCNHNFLGTVQNGVVFDDDGDMARYELERLNSEQIRVQASGSDCLQAGCGGDYLDGQTFDLASGMPDLCECARDDAMQFGDHGHCQ